MTVQDWLETRRTMKCRLSSSVRLPNPFTALLRSSAIAMMLPAGSALLLAGPITTDDATDHRAHATFLKGMGPGPDPNFCTCIAIDGANLWVGTTQGAVRWSLTDYSFRC